YVQQQLRVENAGASYATTLSQFYDRLQGVFGSPGTANTLESGYNAFTSALQALSTSPDDAAARSSVISAAESLTQQLNQTSASINDMRGDAELGISDAVTQVNQALSQIANLNAQIASSSQNDSATATLLDQRDSYIDQLSKLMDIKVVTTDQNQVNIFTNSGVQLLGVKASQLAFNVQGSVTPNSRWSSDPAQSSLGTITLISPNGGSVDLIQSGAIRSGEIAGYLQMRDQDLVQAQSQVDAVAAAMASALSDNTTAGSTVTSGLQSGFSVDIGGMSAGNSIKIGYTDSLTNTPHTITLMRVDDPSALPLADTATADANDKVVGIDFSGGMPSVVAQINTAIAASGMTASNPSGTSLQILDDGAGNIVNVNSLSVTKTITGLSGGSGELPFFVDGTQPYTGAITAAGTQSVGFAGRISVNSALIADPSKLVAYASGVSTGDSTRPNFMYQQLTAAQMTFSPDTGVGGATDPFSGTITTFLRQSMNQQADAANDASNLKQGQDVVLNSLQQRFDDTSSVNIDQEMTNLLSLQNAYAANARVMSTVKNMFDILTQMM